MVKIYFQFSSKRLIFIYITILIGARALKIVRIISRTNIGMWGQDAPDNLCKPLRRKVDVTVLLAFKGDNHNLEEIEYIFAFPQSHCNRLPKLSPEIGSYRQGKVDIPNSPREYKFKSLDELYDTFFKRFANFN